MTELENISRRLAATISSREEDWLSDEAAKLMPPELFLAAYGNLDCKQRAARWLDEQGFQVKIFPDGTRQLCQGEVVISTLESVKIVYRSALLSRFVTA